MSSEGLPVNNVVGTSVDLGARSVQDAANSASSSQNADSAAASADAAWKFSRIAQGAAGDSATAVSDAEAAAAAAAEAAQNAAITANIYPPPAQAVVDTGTIPLNALFNIGVPASAIPQRLADQYQNVGGVATLTGQSIASGGQVDSINQVVSIGYQKATSVAGTENAIQITIPRYFADGTPIFFTAKLTNTDLVTISVTNAAGNVFSSSLLKEGNSPLAAGDIAANNPALVVYRGAPINNWVLVASGGVATSLSKRLTAVESAAVYPLTSQAVTADAYTANCVTDGSALFTDKRVVMLMMPATNTTINPTLSINGGVARAIKSPNGSGINIGDLVAGYLYMLFWQSSSLQWRVMSYPADRIKYLSQYQKATVTSLSSAPNAVAMTMPGFLVDGTQVTFTPVANNTGATQLLITNLAGNTVVGNLLKGANSPLTGNELQQNKIAIAQWRAAPINNFLLVLAGDITTDMAAANAAIAALQGAVSDPLSAIRPTFIDNPFGNITFAPGGIKTVEPRQIICTSIGSSVGVGAGSSNGAIYAPNSQFVDELTKQMALYGNIEIINDNQCIPTQAIQQFSAQLDNSPYTRSDFVLIVAGMNDGPIGNFNAGLTYPGQQARLLALIDKCYARGAIPILCTSPHHDVTKITYALPGGISSTYPIRMFNVAGTYAFNSSNNTITHGYFANSAYGGNILKPGDHLQVGSGPNAGTYTIAGISTDRTVITTVEPIPVTDSSSVNIMQVNADQELVLDPPPSKSVVTRDWTGNGVSVAGDVRFWIMNNMFRSVERQKNCYGADCGQSFMRAVELFGYEAVYSGTNFNHPNDTGYTWMCKPIRKTAQLMAEQVYLNRLVISNS
jgi:hypothetical protein